MGGQTKLNSTSYRLKKQSLRCIGETIQVLTLFRICGGSEKKPISVNQIWWKGQTMKISTSFRLRKTKFREYWGSNTIRHYLSLEERVALKRAVLCVFSNCSTTISVVIPGFVVVNFL